LPMRDPYSPHLGFCHPSRRIWRSVQAGAVTISRTRYTQKNTHVY